MAEPIVVLPAPPHEAPIGGAAEPPYQQPAAEGGGLALVGGRGPPMLKSMPSANSQFAIEQLIGLASSSPTKEPSPRFSQPGSEGGQSPDQQGATPPMLSEATPPHEEFEPSGGRAEGAMPIASAMAIPPGYYAPPPAAAAVHYGQMPPSYLEATPSPHLARPQAAGEVGAAGEPRAPLENWAPQTVVRGVAPHVPVPVALPGVEPGTSAVPNNSAKKAATAAGKDKASGRKGREVVPWRPSEDSTILQGVSEHGCKWSLISQQLPGRSENAVRNRWHRLENAERTRREALEAGLPVEGYRCRKCGHFKKGHMCLGLETVAPDGSVMPTPAASGAKRGRAADAAKPPRKPPRTLAPGYQGMPLQMPPHLMGQPLPQHDPSYPMHHPMVAAHPGMQQLPPGQLPPGQLPPGGGYYYYHETAQQQFLQQQRYEQHHQIMQQHHQQQFEQQQQQQQQQQQHLAQQHLAQPPPQQQMMQQQGQQPQGQPPQPPPHPAAGMMAARQHPPPQQQLPPPPQQQMMPQPGQPSQGQPAPPHLQGHPHLPHVPQLSHLQYAAPPGYYAYGGPPGAAMVYAYPPSNDASPTGEGTGEGGAPFQPAPTSPLTAPLSPSGIEGFSDDVVGSFLHDALEYNSASAKVEPPPQ